MNRHHQLKDSFGRLLESAPDAMVIVDAGGKIVLVNAQTEKLFGYPREELLGEHVEMLVPDRFGDRHTGHLTSYYADPHTRSMDAGLELYGRHKNGSEFAVEISLSPLETEDGTVVSSAIRDITDRRRSEQEASHFRAVVESSHDAIIGKDRDGVITSWNAGAELLYGYTAAEAVGESIAILVPAGHDDELSEVLGRVRSGERVDDYETVRTCKDGTQVDVALTVSPIRDRDGNVTGSSTIARDISGRLRYQQQLQFLADHDALTGAHNRRRFERDVSEQVGRSRRYGEQASLVIIDVDAFKQINDTYGHRAGDLALKAIAAALKARLRETDLVARIGGDEFAVLLPYADAAQAAALVTDLRGVISECSIEVGDHSGLRLPVSIGLVQIDKDTPNDQVVLAAADAAMYAEKGQAKPQ